MYRPHSDFRSLGRLTLILGVVLTVAGCATSSTHEPTGTSTEVLKGRPARVEIDVDVGFTVTEVVPIRSDVRSDYSRALSFLQQEKYQRGIDLLVEVTDKAPEITTPFINLGIAYSRIRAFDEAESSLNEALALTPDHPVALNELGVVYRKMGRFADARQSYEKALLIHSGFHYARRNLAVLCDLYLEDLRCALENYLTYASVVPDDREVGIWVADIRNRITAIEANE